MKFGNRLAPAVPAVTEPVASRAGGGSRGSAPVLDLFPVAAALVADGDGDGGVTIECTNEAFDAGGCAPMVTAGPLAARMQAFLAGEALREEFAWELGDAIDCRTFQVTFARREVSRDPSRCLVALVDHTSEYRTAQSLRREMQTDSLTGLPNRAAFSDLLDRVVGDPATRVAHAILIIDLDRFNRVNACMGGLAGDELLISVARRLKGTLRAQDTLARIGGDEFAIAMALDGGRGDALHVGRRIRAALATPFRLSDFEIKVDCSIGIAFGADLTGGEAEELIRHAQFAVKRSKASGRVETYHLQTFDAVRERFGLETGLRRALDRDELRLSFQPICDLSSGRIISFEALARWTDDGGVEQSPEAFIPVAEESGLIIPLGRWAIDEALRTLASWDAAAGGDCGVMIAVNLSAVQLQRDSIATVVAEALNRHGVAGNRVKLELTESALVTDPDGIARTMRSLKALGSTLAMDDFGTGYSNLAYLQRLPIDLLKIDRSFVTGMIGDPDKVAIVRAILSLAQALGMKTIAEGIETPALAQMLAALGCTYGQGYHFARPLPADAAYALLARDA